MTQLIRARQIDIKILMLSMYDDAQFVARALKAGIDGYLLKHPMDDELFRAIETVLAGATFISQLINTETLHEFYMDESELTPQELEVLQLISEGMNNPQIAELLNISPNTVTRHRANLMQKMNVHNRVELINAAYQRGLITIAGQDSFING